ncbi:hypothetical protein P6B95_01315 [Streptomyces atratus]|uniref:hypothetical protein n=1 Tax=Streptomyces atratus TaxID=1893 RepID=UPI002AC3584B|nr:hypothetical protein [Streptomyces atratus]WPW26236.1 hypothetical protein P6B95_01315 [Streptomyces atratus]
MAYTFARRAAVAVASVAVAAAGLLATGGSASAATPTTGDRPAVVSHSTRPADAHHEGQPGRWDEGWGKHDHSDRGYGVHHHDGHRYRDWDHDDRSRYRVSEDDARRQWVLDQVYWLRDHDARR